MKTSSSRQRMQKELARRKEAKDKELAMQLEEAAFLASPEELMVPLDPKKCVAVTIHDPTTLFSVPEEMGSRSVREMLSSKEFRRFLTANVAQWGLQPSDLDVTGVCLDPPLHDGAMTVGAWRNAHKNASPDSTLLPLPTVVYHLKNGNASRDVLAKENKALKLQLLESQPSPNKDKPRVPETADKMQPPESPKSAPKVPTTTTTTAMVSQATCTVSEWQTLPPPPPTTLDRVLDALEGLRKDIVDLKKQMETMMWTFGERQTQLEKELKSRLGVVAEEK